MSVSPSIFQKACPACASTASLSAKQCRCGHQFESDNTSLADDALRDEELYESYLAARVEQTRQAMIAAFEIHNADPANAEKKTALELSRNVAQEIENDLRAQREKIAALRNAGSHRAAQPRPALPASLPPLTSASTRAAPARAPMAAKPVSPRATIPPAPRIDAPTAAASRAAGVLSALKNAKAREAASSVPSAKAPAPFRQEQSARADRVMNTLSSESTVTCPNCTATLQANTTRCRCGYSFPGSSASDVPSLTLCTSDFTALRNTFLKDLNGRR